MKTCPICGAQAIDRAATCFECLYNFKEMSTGVVLFSELEHKQNLQEEPQLINEEEIQESALYLEDTQSATKLQDDYSQEPLKPQDDYSQVASSSSPCTAGSLQKDELQFRELLIEMYQRGKLRSRYRSHSGSLYVGAAAYNDIKIDTPSVAKRHLHFYRTGDTVFAETLSENYPVYLNGHELSGIVPINANDTISLGEVRFAVSSSLR